MTSPDPYQAPAASVNSPEDVSMPKIGISVGLLFASPFIVFTLLMGAAVALTRGWDQWWILLFFGAIGLAVSLSGCWWGLRVVKMGMPGMLVTAVVQGVLWIAVALGSAIPGIYQDGAPPRFTATDARGTLIGIGIATIVSLVMGLTVRWRIRRALNML